MASILKIDQLVDRLGTGAPTATEGLILPNVAKSGSNVLDWYEEGTWTPTLTAVTPGTMSVTYAIRNGAFVRIGKQITATAYITVSAFTLGTATGDMRVSGLPYVASSANYFAGAASFQGIDIVNSGFTACTDLGQAFVRFLNYTDNLVWANSPISGFAATDELLFTITYFTD